MASASAADRAALTRALAAGMRPRATGSTRGLIVTLPSERAGGKATYKTLIDRKGALTPAGTYYYQQHQAQRRHRAQGEDLDPRH
jgi:hypothetical protein